jgi:hypothetical protein
MIFSNNLIERYFISNQNLLLENSNDELINFRVNFVLNEAKTGKKEKEVYHKAPWGNESWLETNPKIQKNAYVHDNVSGKNIVYHSFIINLLPAKESGINVCACSTADCARTCLHQSGNIGMLVGKTAARFRKTWFLYMDREKAVNEIVNQIKAKKNKIDQMNASGAPYKDIKYPYHVLVIRLNGTSDIRWLDQPVKGAENLFYKFPDVIFYDYTKMPKTAEEYLEDEYFHNTLNKKDKFPPNYHITFSYGGEQNKNNTLKLLEKNINIAVAFAPGKTNSMEELIFPTSMDDLFRNFKYPLADDGQQMSAMNQRQLKSQIINEMEQKGVYCESSELSDFAGETLLPGYFQCHEVIDGDKYDGRFLDDFYFHKSDDKYFTNAKTFQVAKKNKPGLVIGLTAKGPLAYEYYDHPADDSEGGWDINKTGKFVVGPKDSFLDTSLCPNPDATLIKKTEVYKKLTEAIFILRNHDARHKSLQHAIQGTMDRRKVQEIKKDKIRKLSKPKEADLLHTYKATKERFQKEMDHVRLIFAYVLNPKFAREPKNRAEYEALMKSGGKENKKFRDVETFAVKFKNYIDQEISSGRLSQLAAEDIKNNMSMIFNPDKLLSTQTLFQPEDLLKKLIQQRQTRSTEGFKEWFNYLN